MSSAKLESVRDAHVTYRRKFFAHRRVFVDAAELILPLSDLVNKVTVVPNGGVSLR